MTPLEQIRANIDDYPQVGFTVEASDGNMRVYQLNSRNFWDLTVTQLVGEDDEAVVEAEDYTTFPQSGQIKGEFEEGDVQFEYTHAGFTDAELTHYLSVNGDSVAKASLACVKILLASAAKRFDYKAGIKDIKASQVFDHLTELHKTLTEQVELEDTGAIEGGVIVTRVHPAYQMRPVVPRDVSRGLGI